MFDGADLALAYGASYDPSPPLPPNTQVAPPPPPVQVGPDPASSSHALPPDMPYSPPNAMYAQQSPNATPMSVATSTTFWDRLGEKKGEMLKLVGLALVILFAVSLDRVSTHYLTTYISKAFLTDMQELLVRLSYPVIVILILWIMKALM